jgi:NDP-sugar pyrophosphorylase family protein
MNTMDCIPAVLLVGGKGTRLRPVLPSTPKPLASLGGGSFLELLVRQLQHHGIRHLVMCTGFLAEQIENEFGDGSAWGVDIEYSREQCPLGTAGAVHLAHPYLLDTTQFLVMNGDSFLESDFARLVQFHREHGGLVSMAVFRATDASRYGTVEVAAGNRVARFAEKTSVDAPGLVNAGVYVFDQAVFEYITPGPASLEKDVFPRILQHGVYALEQHGMFIDIGIPEDYARAQVIREQLFDAAFQRHGRFHDAEQ